MNKNEKEKNIKTGIAKKSAAALAAAALVLGISGCTSVKLANASFAEKEIIISAGQSVSVTPVYTYSKEQPNEKQINAALKKAAVKWQSSDENVAAVNVSGEITAKAAGTAVITLADSAGRIKADLKVTVIVPVNEVTAEKEITLNLLAMQTGKTGLKIMPETATNVDIAYKSSNEAVAIVNNKGKIMPISEGEAEIIATVKGDSGNGRAETAVKTKVLVKKLPLGIELESTEGVLSIGGKYTLKPFTAPEGAPESTYSFASSDEKVAAVDKNGAVTAKGAGKCEITITSAEGHTAVYTLTVNQAPKTGGANAGAAGGTTGTGGGSAGGTGGGTGGGTAVPAPTPPPAPNVPNTPAQPTPPPAPSVPVCDKSGPGHAQVGRCPVCLLINGGIYDGGPDGGQTDGLS